MPGFFDDGGWGGDDGGGELHGDLVVDELVASEYGKEPEVSDY